MKKLILPISISLLLLGCGSKKISNPNEIVSKSSIQSNLEYLASDALNGRATATEGIDKAATHIENFFNSNGIKPYFDEYRDYFEFTGKVRENDSLIERNFQGFNVVGYIEGNDPELKKEFVVLGAHYDHIGKGNEVDGDTIANGANDDASGTVAVMEWSKYFAKTKSNKRSVLFTLFDAEEMGLKGSLHLAKKLKEQDLNLYTMINFEMVGVPRDLNESMAYITGYDLSNIPETLNSFTDAKVVGFFPKAKEYQLFYRSDNYAFFKEFNIPAHAISTFDFTNFEYYHHVDDEADKMDYDHMTNFVLKMIPALEGMINSPTQVIKLYEE
jgi:Zn-dependent M28 family amino/carboxypeptidase